MSRRVVITGMGVVSPLGDSPDTLFRHLIAGKSGVNGITHFDAQSLPTRFAAEVRDFDLGRYLPDPSLWRDAGLASQFAAAASRLALSDAGLLDDEQVDRERFGIYLGTGEGTQQFDALMGSTGVGYLPAVRSFDTRKYADHAFQFYFPGREYEQELHTPTAHLADTFRLAGPNYSCLTACAAGAQAIAEAVDLIRCGDADLMLTGGAHSMIHPLGVTGFNLLTALSTRNDHPQKASRPFDRDRDGFVLGEGSGMVILEELDHARNRGATILGEVTGCGVTCDAFRVTDSHPEGRGAAACMRDALQNARLNPSDIGYINAHGTSTRVNDSSETLAIKTVFGEAAYRVLISSTKSMLGHLIGAAGAVELIICVEAIRRGQIPPTINYETPDPVCDLDYVPNTPRSAQFDHALSNSFGFGGQNVSLIVSRF
ncbi:MAG: beta-ketoacyl-[acyl-carrier-protein] synthase family protein [Bacteroidales bacterium]|nr:beta-ketoacyl-[acyl-carrier-protein] synthase family protein [Bacteroidales bacterium]